jgi:hypothetical protein
MISIRYLLLVIMIMMIANDCDAAQFGFYQNETAKTGAAMVLDIRLQDNQKQSIYPDIKGNATDEVGVIADFIDCLADSAQAALCYQQKTTHYQPQINLT